MWSILNANGCLIVVLYISLTSAVSVILKAVNTTADTVSLRSPPSLILPPPTSAPVLKSHEANITVVLSNETKPKKMDVITIITDFSVPTKPKNDTALTDTVTSKTTPIIINSAPMLSPVLRSIGNVTKKTSTAKSTPNINTKPVFRQSETTAAPAATTAAVEKTTEDPLIDDFKSLGAKGWCKMQPNGYDCSEKGTTKRYYYDLKFEDCIEAEHGLCDNNFNRYGSQKSCRSSCQDEGTHPFTIPVTSKIYCTFQPDFGECNSYYPKFYFDVTHRECRGFSYSGCGGNLNRFSSFQVCSAICMPLVEYKLKGGEPEH